MLSMRKRKNSDPWRRPAWVRGPRTVATVPPQNDQQEEVKPQRWGTVTFEYLGMVRLAAVAFSFETSGMVRWAAMGKERDRGEMWACMHAEEGRGG